MTIRNILSRLADCVDFDESHYICTSIILPFADGKERIFGVTNDDDKRREMYVVLGKNCSTFKHDHIKTVYCILPRDLATPDIEQYRDLEDPYMYKYRLPERVFNSILNQLEIDLDAAVRMACECYAQTGYEWDGRDNWRRKVREWFGYRFPD